MFIVLGKQGTMKEKKPVRLRPVGIGNDCAAIKAILLYRINRNGNNKQALNMRNSHSGHGHYIYRMYITTKSGARIYRPNGRPFRFWVDD